MSHNAFSGRGRDAARLVVSAEREPIRPDA